MKKVVLQSGLDFLWEEGDLYLSGLFHP